MHLPGWGSGSRLGERVAYSGASGRRCDASAVAAGTGVSAAGRDAAAGSDDPAISRARCTACCRVFDLPSFGITAARVVSLAQASCRARRGSVGGLGRAAVVWASRPAQ